MKTKNTIYEWIFYCSVLLILADANPCQVHATVVAKYSFDEGGGNIVLDSSGNENHGTITGATYLEDVSGTIFYDGALEFLNSPSPYTTPATDYVTISDSPSLRPTNSLIIEAWVKPYPYYSTQGRCIVSKSCAGVWGQTSYILWYENAGMKAGNVAFCLYDGPRAVTIFTPFPPPDEWYHIEAEWDGSFMRIYIDGALKVSLAFAGPIAYDNNPVYIGAQHFDGQQRSGWYGLMDQIIIHGQSILEVIIDIKPGSYPNAVNLGSHGLIPVAILSSDDFDATMVDPDTVELAGAGVRVRGKSNKYMAHEEDINDDELIDLVAQVATENLDPGAFQDGYAVLTGSTYDGQQIQGSDEITIVPSE